MVVVVVVVVVVVDGVIWERRWRRKLYTTLLQEAPSFAVIVTHRPGSVRVGHPYGRNDCRRSTRRNLIGILRVVPIVLLVLRFTSGVTGGPCFLFVCLYLVTCIPLHAARRAIHGSGGEVRVKVAGYQPMGGTFCGHSDGSCGPQDLHLSDYLQQAIPAQPTHEPLEHVDLVRRLGPSAGWCFRRCAVGRRPTIWKRTGLLHHSSLQWRAQNHRHHPGTAHPRRGRGRRRRRWPAPRAPPGKNRRDCGFLLSKFVSFWLAGPTVRLACK